MITNDKYIYITYELINYFSTSSRALLAIWKTLVNNKQINVIFIDITTKIFLTYYYFKIFTNHHIMRNKNNLQTY